MVESRKWMRNKFGAASVAVAVGLIVVHYFQFDSLAAVTLVPPWCWLVPALLTTWFSFRLDSRIVLWAGLVFWGIFVALFVEEASSLLRFGQQSAVLTAAEKPATIRVVTLNCNVGNPNAANEVVRFMPDIILFQESPSDRHLAELSNENQPAKCAYVWGGDTSILVNGSLEAIHIDKSSHFSHALATLKNGRQVDVVSLRLCPPVFRVDFWSSEFWNDHRQRRRQRRQQLSEIRAHLDMNQKTDYLVIGGDFNAAGNDGSFVPAMNGLQDSFLTAGTGWGNTGTNDIPIFRVDQIWSTRNLECEIVKAYKTIHSDHRFVICDLRIQASTQAD